VSKVPLRAHRDFIPKKLATLNYIKLTQNYYKLADVIVWSPLQLIHDTKIVWVILALSEYWKARRTSLTTSGLSCNLLAFISADLGPCITHCTGRC
jgi:hypothetical protein